MFLEFLIRLGDEVGVSAYTQHFDGLDAASADQIAAHGSLPHDPTVEWHEIAVDENKKPMQYDSVRASARRSLRV